MRLFLQLLRFAWASPWTLFGASVGLLGLIGGTRLRRCGPTLEFWGGPVAAILRRMPFGGASAMTLGHVILAIDTRCLESAREHEMVHVRQYERWGPAFIPAYLGCSLALWLTGRHPYFDNPFEREAYGISD